MKLTIEWMSQLREGAGMARQAVDCPDGTHLNEALEQVLTELHPDRASALRPLLMAGEHRSSALLVAVDGVQIASDQNPVLSAGAILLLSSPIAGG
jgi:hypothetical protein